jgi:hypothetical protein
VIPSARLKKNLLLSLFVLAVILIAANIFLQSDLPDSVSDEDVIDEHDLSRRFIKILYEFGIEDRLIKETKLTDKQSGHEISNIRVQVPKDLSIPEILQDIFQTFRDSFQISSEEKIKGSKTNLVLKVDNSPVLQAEFDYTYKYSRNSGSVSFIIKIADPGSESTSELIESPERLNFLIRPETKHLQHLAFIRNSGQQFSVLIDDDIDEQRYKLGASYSEQRVITVIKTLVTDFQKALCFIIDEDSKFCKSTNFEILKRELSKRKIKFFNTADFVRLDKDETLPESFNRKMEALSSNQSVVFLLDEESYEALKSELEKYKKKGHRIISSSSVL